MNESSLRWQAWLADGQTSPSQKAEKNEDLLRLANALEKLPAPQREAVVLHHLQAMSLAELAKYLGRSEPAVAGLLHRGLKKLRELLQDQDAP
jgi:RNA polymerase sigma-70 factor (ECF subfamily)